MPAQHWPLPACPTAEQIMVQEKEDPAGSGPALYVPTQALYQPWNGLHPAFRGETGNVLGFIYPGLTPAELLKPKGPGKTVLTRFLRITPKQFMLLEQLVLRHATEDGVPRAPGHSVQDYIIYFHQDCIGLLNELTRFTKDPNVPGYHLVSAAATKFMYQHIHQPGEVLEDFEARMVSYSLTPNTAAKICIAKKLLFAPERDITSQTREEVVSPDSADNLTDDVNPTALVVTRKSSYSQLQRIPPELTAYWLWEVLRAVRDSLRKKKKSAKEVKHQELALAVAQMQQLHQEERRARLAADARLEALALQSVHRADLGQLVGGMVDEAMGENISALMDVKLSDNLQEMCALNQSNLEQMRALNESNLEQMSTLNESNLEQMQLQADIAQIDTTAAISALQEGIVQSESRLKTYTDQRVTETETHCKTYTDEQQSRTSQVITEMQADISTKLELLINMVQRR